MVSEISIPEQILKEKKWSRWWWVKKKESKNEFTHKDMIYNRNMHVCTNDWEWVGKECSCPIAPGYVESWNKLTSTNYRHWSRRL